MATLQAVLDLARSPLNDDKDSNGSDALCRNKDSALLSFSLHGLLHIWRNRADLFVGNFANPPSLAWTAGATFPLQDEYIQPLADYVTARVEAGDDEFTEDARIKVFFDLFGNSVPL